MKFTPGLSVETIIVETADALANLCLGLLRGAQRRGDYRCDACASSAARASPRRPSPWRPPMRCLCEPEQLALGRLVDVFDSETTGALPLRACGARPGPLRRDHRRGEHRCAACASLWSLPRAPSWRPSSWSPPTRCLGGPVELVLSPFPETLGVESIVVDHPRGDHRCAACASLRSSPWVSS